MRFAFTGLLVTAALAIATPTQAHWQYTRWGMSPKEVEAASGGKTTPYTAVERLTSDGSHIVLTAPYQVQGLNFHAQFAFDRPVGKLNKVTLFIIAQKSKCYDVAILLDRTYGTPEGASSDKHFTNRSWRDHANGNHVKYSEYFTGNTCLIEYTPLIIPNKSGGL